MPLRLWTLLTSISRPPMSSTNPCRSSGAALAVFKLSRWSSALPLDLRFIAIVSRNLKSLQSNVQYLLHRPYFLRCNHFIDENGFARHFEFYCCVLVEAIHFTIWNFFDIVLYMILQIFPFALRELLAALATSCSRRKDWTRLYFSERSPSLKSSRTKIPTNLAIIESAVVDFSLLRQLKMFCL